MSKNLTVFILCLFILWIKSALGSGVPDMRIYGDDGEYIETKQSKAKLYADGILNPNYRLVIAIFNPDDELVIQDLFLSESAKFYGACLIDGNAMVFLSGDFQEKKFIAKETKMILHEQSPVNEPISTKMIIRKYRPFLIGRIERNEVPIWLLLVGQIPDKIKNHREPVKYPSPNQKKLDDMGAEFSPAEYLKAVGYNEEDMKKVLGLYGQIWAWQLPLSVDISDRDVLRGKAPVITKQVEASPYSNVLDKEFLSDIQYLSQENLMELLSRCNSQQDRIKAIDDLRKKVRSEFAHLILDELIKNISNTTTDK